MEMCNTIKTLKQIKGRSKFSGALIHSVALANHTRYNGRYEGGLAAKQTLVEERFRVDNIKNTTVKDIDTAIFNVILCYRRI